MTEAEKERAAAIVLAMVAACDKNGRCPEFDCAICGRHQANTWPGPFREWPIPPVCRMCESEWGKEVGSAGNFRDRRMAKVLAAMAERLSAESTWRIYGYA